MTIQNYRDLIVWQKAIELVERIYQHTESFPKSQQYTLTSQLQRAAISVPANIAEGRSRHSQNDFIYHLNIARGSLAEVETFIIIAQRLSYLSEIETESTLQATNEITRMLHGLKTSLQKPTELKPVTENL